MSLRSRIFSAISALALTAGLVACANVSEAAPSLQGVPSSLAKFYTQKITWAKCGSILCSNVMVPMNWADPTGATINIAINVHKARKSTHYLLVNPGGPGASGTDFVKSSYSYIGTATMRAYYNVVGFDPRGTGTSSPVNCLDNAGLDDLLYGDSPYALGSAQDIAFTRTTWSNFATACQQHTGAVLQYLDTVSAAKDMDVIRAALGQKKLDYLGYSYGTFLGTTYAALFPTKVNRFVLDGAIDPRVSDEQSSLSQLQGFDKALTDYVTWCLARLSCPLTGTVAEARDQISAILRHYETATADSQLDDRKLNLSSLETGLIMGLYSNSYWKYLNQAFSDLLATPADGTWFMRLADAYNDRNADGTYADNIFSANIAINCLDGRSASDDASMAAQNQKVLAASSVFGRYWQYGALGCASWPYPVAQRPASYAAKGSPTIMVIGTTGDPATPYQQAVDLAHKVLAKGFLVTYKGEGHTAYGRSNQCIATTVDNFLTKGTLPKKEPKC